MNSVHDYSSCGNHKFTTGSCRPLVTQYLLFFFYGYSQLNIVWYSEQRGVNHLAAPNCYSLWILLLVLTWLAGHFMYWGLIGSSLLTPLLQLIFLLLLYYLRSWMFVHKNVDINLDVNFFRWIYFNIERNSYALGKLTGQISWFLKFKVWICC